MNTYVFASVFSHAPHICPACAASGRPDTAQKPPCGDRTAGGIVWCSSTVGRWHAQRQMVENRRVWVVRRSSAAFARSLSHPATPEGLFQIRQGLPPGVLPQRIPTPLPRSACALPPQRPICAVFDFFQIFYFFS